MSDHDCSVWQGVVQGGEMKGYQLEVRRQRLPWALYVMAFTAPESRAEPIIGFAVGRFKLAEQLHDLGTEVTWADGRGPLAPERDRPQHKLHPGGQRRRGRRSALSITLQRSPLQVIQPNRTSQARRSSRR